MLNNKKISNEKQTLADQYNELAATYQKFQSVKFHADLKSKQLANEMAEIKAKLESLGAFGDAK